MNSKLETTKNKNSYHANLYINRNIDIYIYIHRYIDTYNNNVQKDMVTIIESKRDESTGRERRVRRCVCRNVSKWDEPLKTGSQSQICRRKYLQQKKKNRCVEK